MGGLQATNLAHELANGHVYINIYVLKIRPLSFIIPSHHFFVFEVTRYISFPSSPHWSQNETPLH